MDTKPEPTRKCILLFCLRWSPSGHRLKRMSQTVNLKLYMIDSIIKTISPPLGLKISSLVCLQTRAQHLLGSQFVIPNIWKTVPRTTMIPFKARVWTARMSRITCNMATAERLPDKFAKITSVLEIRKPTWISCFKSCKQMKDGLSTNLTSTASLDYPLKMMLGLLCSSIISTNLSRSIILFSRYCQPKRLVRVKIKRLQSPLELTIPMLTITQPCRYLLTN